MLGTRLRDEGPEIYAVAAHEPTDVAKADMEACIAIVQAGGAVDPTAAAMEIPKARVLAVARKGKEIVGVGAIKRVRRGYARQITRSSDRTFSFDTPELGYVVVEPEHREQGLAFRIVAELLSAYEGPLFATTDNDHMKRTLSKATFLQVGQQWGGRRGRRSLWVRA